MLRPFIAFFLGLLLVGAPVGHAATNPTPDKPNIIIFLVDDMGVMDTSVPMLTDAAGNPQRHPLNDFYRTPAMERLAKQGIRFSQFYAQSVCSPTRTSILTGQNATRHRTTNWINPFENNRAPFGPAHWNWEGLKPGDVTLASVLKQAGYRTIHIGKAHFGPLGKEGADPLKIGFDINIGGAAWGHPKSYYGEDHYGNHPKYEKPTHNVSHLEAYHGSDVFLSEALTREAIGQIKKSVEAGTPFYLNMAHYAVHAPFQPDKRFIDDYSSSKKSGSAKAFASLIAGMDKSLGDLLDTLEDLGVAENTLILFLGDNGTDAPLGKDHEIACAAPLRGKKGTCYEGGMRTPLIAAWAHPDAKNPWQRQLPIAENAIQTQLASVMDLFPTIVALASAPVPEKHTVDGRNLKPLLTGQRDASRPEMFLMHYPHSHRSMYFTCFRLGNWKLITHYNPQAPQNPRYELFDLSNDPSESNNLADTQPERLASMLQAMSDQLQKEGALFPETKNGAPIAHRAY